jgi:hypothetical protein
VNRRRHVLAGRRSRDTLAMCPSATTTSGGRSGRGG